MAIGKQIVNDGDVKSTPRVRDERIDSVKYCLILLVIAGHIFIRSEFSENISCVVTWQWIYIFHMPLFIFISGYFSRKQKKEELPGSLWRLLEPFIVFQAITILPRFVVRGFSISSILTPWFALWYLLSLVYWRLMLQIIPDRILSHTKLILIVTSCISLIAGFFPFDKLLSIQRTLAFMPFFFLGYFMRGKKLYLPKKYKPLCFVVLALAVVVPLFWPQSLGNLTHAEPYGNVYGAVKRMIALGLAVPMSIAFINVCPNRPWMARQGRFTMQYYIYHGLLLVPLMVIVNKLHVPMNYASATVCTLVIAIVIGLASRWPYFTNFTNPSSFFKKEVKRNNSSSL